MAQQQQHRQTRDAYAITWWSVGINGVLGLGKIVTGWVGHSQALIADGLHSLTDIATDIATLVGFTMAAKPGDQEHPFGHHKFASLANLFIAVMILVFCVGLITMSIGQLHQSNSRVPGILPLVAAVLSIGLKEILFQRTRAIARRLKSRLLMANAWHHRTDSISSIVAAIAVAAAYVGGPSWAFLDKVVGIALGGFLFFEGIKLFTRAANDLLDRAPDNELIDDLREHILPIDGALAYHEFRARRVGDWIEIDLHLQVDPRISVHDGHEIATRVEREILRRHPEVFSVLVHIEPATHEHIAEQGIFDFSSEATGRKEV